jgi:hypothetical protein
MTYPRKMTVTLTAAGNDISAYVQNGSLQIKNILTRQIDTCSFQLVSPAYIPDDWDEVVVTAGGANLFGGYVQKVTAQLLGDGTSKLSYRVDCSDYTVLLAKTLVKAEYTAATDGGMITDLFWKYLPEITISYVRAIKTHDRRRFNRKSLREIIDDLSDSAGADWYVDASKNLHYFLSEETAAPYGLADVGSANYTSTFPMQDLVVDTNGSNVFNRVEVVGSFYRSTDQTIYVAGTGVDTRVIMPFGAHAPTGSSGIQVWRNDGSLGSPSWTQMTVKTGYIDTLGASTEVLHYYSERVLEQQAAWPALANAVKVTAQFDIPLRTRVRDQASYDHYGRWLDTLITDTNLVSQDTAKMAGRGQLAQTALATTALRCTVWEPGLAAGQTISVVESVQGINANYLVREVDTTVIDMGYTQYNLQLGVYDPSLVDIIAALARASKKEPIWRDDEVLDEILEQIETIVFTDTANAIVTSTGPYKWSPTGAGAFNWGYAKWG